MSESTKAALAASVAAGYVLGRGHKAKLAMAVAAYLASKRLKVKPQELLAAGAGKLGESPQLAQLAEQVRGEVLSVGRQALKAAADRRLGSFADSLADRTKSLSQVLEEAEEKSKGEEGEEEEGPEEGRGEGPEERGPREGEEEGPEEEAEERPKRGAERTAEKRARPRRPPREPEMASASAKKTAKKAPPRKGAQQIARKPPAESSRRRR